MEIYDIGIIGAGVAGAFATYNIAKNSDLKTVVFDLGRPPMKRRRQLEGWLGCLPNGDGKLYLNNIDSVAQLIGSKKAKSTSKNILNMFSKVCNIDEVIDRSPLVPAQKRIEKFGYGLSLNNHIQIIPKDVHALSKIMAAEIEANKNITYSFDNEVISISKDKKMFVIQSQEKEFHCKKILVAVGRSGWRWVKDLYEKFGIIEDDSVAKYGIRLEIASTQIKDFNRSNCTLTRDNIEIGPLCWGGTVIPEDHLDLAISAFRSNENRWKTDKVSFTLIGNVPADRGVYETDRLGKLTFILSNDRIIKEKVSSLIKKTSKISVIPDYNWLIPELQHLSNVMPEIVNRGYFHVPTIMPFAPRIKIDEALHTEVEGMYVAGESAGVHGILAAASMGIAASNSIIG
jgi:hypothetical protein